MQKKILVTGAAGFIGFHTCLRLLKLGWEVHGIDNLNEYYDINLKTNRLKYLGIFPKERIKSNYEYKSDEFQNFKFTKIDLSNFLEIESLFKKYSFKYICHLAAQAGVRYSISEPRMYLKSNIEAFLNILEISRYNGVEHLIYASSSSVYGDNDVPFSIDMNVDKPISFYAATKKSNELMAYSYSHLFGFQTTGLRFFTVYGPWGRPDMAYYSFCEKILNDEPLLIYNNGKMERDFTYIDDVVDGIVEIASNKNVKRSLYEIYNLGNNKTINLLDFIEILELNMNKKAKKVMTVNQQGDVPRTWADISVTQDVYGYNPSTTVEEGIAQFVKWFKTYKTEN